MEIAAIIRGSALKLVVDIPQTESAQPQPDWAAVNAPAPPFIAFPHEAEPVVEEVVGPRELMMQAKDLLKSTQRGGAIPLLKRIVREFPESNEGKQARSFLERAGVNS